jgi:hypothetical protein
MTTDRYIRLVAAAIIALFAVETLLFIDWIPDDAFICFRFAQNLADGAGMVFNAGDRVEGVSNPLWTALLGLLTRGGLDTVKTAVVLSFLCSLASVALSLRLFDAVLSAGQERERRRFVGLRTALAVGLVTSFPMVFYATSGLETHAELALLLLGAVLHLEARSTNDGRRYAASQFAFLGVALLRPEGVMFLLLGTVFAAISCRRDKRVWISIAAPLVVYAAAFALRVAYYGEMVPNTYFAKPGASPGYLLPLWRGSYYLVRFFLVRGMVLLLPFCANAFTDRRRRYTAVFLASLVAAQLAFIVFVGGDVLRFDRFTLPFTPLLLALALVGFIRLDGVARVRARRLSMGAAVFCVALMTGLNAGRVGLTLKKLCYHDWMSAQVHRRVGAYLGRALPPGASVVVNEVGAIAYESRLVIHDMIGLTDATVGRILYESFMRFGDSGTPWSVPRIADYLMSKSPDCVVVPSYGQIDPETHAPVGNLMHPVWEGVYVHPELASRYRCAFWIRIHDHKFWYIYTRDGVALDPAPAGSLTSARCMSVHDCPVDPRGGADPAGTGSRN